VYVTVIFGIYLLKIENVMRITNRQSQTRFTLFDDISRTIQ